MNTYKVTVHSEEETIELAENIESEKFPNMVICLNGDLGSGKTVFAKAFGHAMGIDDVTSPTFNIIKEYNGARPSKKAFKTEKKVEHVIKGFLSFNKEDKENIFQVYEWNKNFIDEEEYFAIANDPFGNYIISDKRGKIYYFEHEAGNIEFVADSFEKFIELLYD